MIKTLTPLPLAAKRTALPESSIRRMIHAGAIDAQKLGRDWYIPVDEVERLSREYPLEGSVNG
jgi:excisionase family DNA binding protein